MKKNELIIVEGKSVGEMAHALCRMASLEEMIRDRLPSHVKKEPLIALKPNLVGPIPAQDGATTHPQIVKGVVEYLRNCGFRNLVVMESSWVGDKTSDSLLVTGFGELCRDLNIPFWDLQQDRGIRKDAAGMELNVCERALSVDYLINLPVLKGHCQTRMTCALKNMKGCIPASEKRHFHRAGLHKPIGHLSAAIHQDFVIADAICPDLTFEDGGNPVQLNRMICAADPVLLDAYGAQALGLSVDDVPYISIAQECGAGCCDTDCAKVSCYLERRSEEGISYTSAEAPALPWDTDHSRQLIGLKAVVDELDSCSACYGTLIPVLKKLEAEGVLDRINEKICIGQGYQGKTGKLGIGSCTTHFRNNLPGCPPTAEEMEQFLRSLD